VGGQYVDVEVDVVSIDVVLYPHALAPRAKEATTARDVKDFIMTSCIGSWI